MIKEKNRITTEARIKTIIGTILNRKDARMIDEETIINSQYSFVNLYVSVSPW